MLRLVSILALHKALMNKLVDQCRSMTTLPTTPISKIRAGVGRVSASLHGSSILFSELSSTYPLKLLAPRVSQDGVAVVYILTYGGGLVGGDHVTLSVDTGPGAVLVLLSQVRRLHKEMRRIHDRLY